MRLFKWKKNVEEGNDEEEKRRKKNPYCIIYQHQLWKSTWKTLLLKSALRWVLCGIQFLLVGQLLIYVRLLSVIALFSAVLFRKKFAQYNAKTEDHDPSMDDVQLLILFFFFHNFYLWCDIRLRWCLIQIAIYLLHCCCCFFLLFSLLSVSILLQ